MIRKRLLTVLGVIGMTAFDASADIMLTYESDVDVFPDNGDVIDLYHGNAATISIWAWPGSTAELAGTGFNFNGSDDGGVLYYDAFSLSNFAWDPATFGNPNVWFTDNTLPQPRGANFIGAATIPAEGLLLATLQVTAFFDEHGPEEVTTGPEFFNGSLAPVIGNRSGFTVRIVPEPSTSALLAIGGLAMMRRR